MFGIVSVKAILRIKIILGLTRGSVNIFLLEENYIFIAFEEISSHFMCILAWYTYSCVMMNFLWTFREKLFCNFF